MSVDIKIVINKVIKEKCGCCRGTGKVEEDFGNYCNICYGVGSTTKESEIFTITKDNKNDPLIMDQIINQIKSVL